MGQWIIDLVGGVGTAIANSGFGQFISSLNIGGLVKSGFDTVMKWGSTFVEGVKDVAGQAWDWLSKPFEGLFGAKSATEAGDALLGAVGPTASPSSGGFTEWLFGADEVAQGSAAAGVSAGAKSAASAASEVASSSAMQQTGGLIKPTAGADALLGAKAGAAMPDLAKDAAKGGLGGMFSDTTEFFSKPVNQWLGKGAMALVANQLEGRQARKQMQAMSQEAQRQEAERQRKWIEEQNRQAELTRWQVKNKFDTERANKQNRFAGLSGRVLQPAADVPNV
jgi:hypothetical protein